MLNENIKLARELETLVLGDNIKVIVLKNDVETRRMEYDVTDTFDTETMTTDMVLRADLVGNVIVDDEE